MRDFSPGVVSTVDDTLLPDNILVKSINAYSDEAFNNKLGNLKRRPGYYYIDSTSSKTGQFSDTEAGGLVPAFTKNSIVGLFNGDTTLYAAVNDNTSYNKTVIFYYSSYTWAPITATNTFNKNARIRFEYLGNRIYCVQYGIDMKSFVPGAYVLGTTNCLVGITVSLIKEYQGRLYTAGTFQNDNKVYFSSPVDSSNNITWDTTYGWFKVGLSDMQTITGFEVNNILLIFKLNGMYTYNGVSTQSEPLYNVGALNQEVIQTIKGVTYFAGPVLNTLKIFEYTGSEPVDISTPVKDWLYNYAYEYLVNGAGTYYDMQYLTSSFKDEDNYYISLGDVTYKDGITYSNIVLRFNLTHRSWTVYSFADQVLIGTVLQTRNLRGNTAFNGSSSVKGNLTIIGDDSGTVSTFGTGNTDNGVSIDSELKTKKLNFGSSARIKTIGKFFGYCDGNFAETTVHVIIDGKKPQYVGTFTDKITTFELAEEGREFEFVVLNHGNTLSTLNDTTLGSEAFIFKGFEFPNVDIQEYES